MNRQKNLKTLTQTPRSKNSENEEKKLENLTTNKSTGFQNNKSHKEIDISSEKIIHNTQKVKKSNAFF